MVLVCLREIRGLRNKREARRYFADSAQAAGTDVLPMKHDVICDNRLLPLLSSTLTLTSPHNVILKSV